MKAKEKKNSEMMNNKKLVTKCKRNCGFCAKIKVCIFVQTVILNWKVSAFKSATTLT